MSASLKPWYLKQLDLFEGVADAEIMSIAKQLTEKECTKNELLYTPFDSSENIFILKKGEVTLYHLHKGKKIVIDVLVPGDIWGAIDFDQKNSSHFAEVTKQSYMCILPLQDFLEILRAKPLIMLRFLQRISTRLSYYEERLKDPLLDAKEKILNLQKRAQDHKRGWFSKIVGGSSMTHEEIAQHTGLSRETVTRTLAVIRSEEKQGK